LTLVENVGGEDLPLGKIGTNPSQVLVNINDASTIVARNPSTITETYDNVITGKTVIWNNQTQELTIRVDTQPILDDFTGRIQDNTAFNRNAIVGDQVDDIFRVGDFIKYPEQTDDEAYFLEVGTVSYTNGSEFVPEDSSRNSSSIAKYLTKEVSISSPATAIDVHLTVNVKDFANVRVLYKYKKASSQENFDDLDWEYFNADGSPDNLEIATPENSISSVVEKQSSYQDVKYSVSDLPEFSSFAIKVVMKGVDPAFVPKIQDIRAVAAF